MNCYLAKNNLGQSQMFPVSEFGLACAILCAHEMNGQVERVRPSEYNEIVWDKEIS